MGLRRRLERLEASSEATANPDGGRLQDVEEWLDELDIHRGELDPAGVPNLEERRREAQEVFTELQDEWRRLEQRRLPGGA